MLLNKIPVLDDGYVALISSAVPHLIYRDVVDEFLGARDNANLKKVCYATMVIKAPVFFQLHIAQHGFSLVSTAAGNEGAYKPNPGEIGGSDHETNRLIADDISRTTHALLINPAAYTSDGADKFIAQIIMPVSTYSTFLVGGTLDQWQKFVNVRSVPNPIKAYTLAIEQILKAEWK